MAISLANRIVQQEQFPYTLLSGSWARAFDSRFAIGNPWPDVAKPPLSSAQQGEAAPFLDGLKGVANTETFFSPPDFQGSPSGFAQVAIPLLCRSKHGSRFFPAFSGRSMGRFFVPGMSVVDLQHFQAGPATTFFVINMDVS